MPVFEDHQDLTCCFASQARLEPPDFDPVPNPSRLAVFFLHFLLPTLCVGTNFDTLPGPREHPFSYSKGPDQISE